MELTNKELLVKEKIKYNLEPSINKYEEKLLSKKVPIQYIIGYVEFLNTKIIVNEKVLIPRYETEEMAHLFLQNYYKDGQKILDLCCGSGFIGLAIANNRAQCDITISDIDNDALVVAKQNIAINNLEWRNIKVIKSNLFDNISEKYDVIISNPPYLDYFDEDVDESVRNFEPAIALYAPDKGWYFYKKILNNYRSFLNKGGFLILEINNKHKLIWQKFKKAHILKDINGKDRFVVIKNND